MHIIHPIPDGVTQKRKRAQENARETVTRYKLTTSSGMQMENEAQGRRREIIASCPSATAFSSFGPFGILRTTCVMRFNIYIMNAGSRYLVTRTHI